MAASADILRGQTDLKIGIKNDRIINKPVAF